MTERPLLQDWKQNDDFAFAIPRERSHAGFFLDDGSMKTGKVSVACPRNNKAERRKAMYGTSLRSSKLPETKIPVSKETATPMSANSIRMYGRPTSDETKRTAQACLMGARCAIMQQVRKVASCDPRMHQPHTKELTMHLPLLPRRQPNDRRSYNSVPYLTDGKIRNRPGRIPRFSDAVAASRMERCAIVLQNFWRMYSAKKECRTRTKESALAEGHEEEEKQVQREEAFGELDTTKDNAATCMQGLWVWHPDVHRRREAAAVSIQKTVRSSKARQILAVLRAERQVRYFQMLIGNMRDDIWIEELGNEFGPDAFYRPSFHRNRSRRTRRRRRQTSSRRRRRHRFRLEGFVSSLETICETKEEQQEEHEVVKTPVPGTGQTSFRLRPYGYRRQAFLPSLPPPPSESPSLPSPRLESGARGSGEASKKRRGRKKFSLGEENQPDSTTTVPPRIVSCTPTRVEVSSSDVRCSHPPPSVRRLAFSKSQVDSFFRDRDSDGDEVSTQAPGTESEDDPDQPRESNIDDDENAGVGFINRLFFGHNSAVPFWKGG